MRDVIGWVLKPSPQPLGPRPYGLGVNSRVKTDGPGLKLGWVIRDPSRIGSRLDSKGRTRSNPSHNPMARERPTNFDPPVPMVQGGGECVRKREGRVRNTLR